MLTLEAKAIIFIQQTRKYYSEAINFIHLTKDISTASLKVRRPCTKPAPNSFDSHDFTDPRLTGSKVRNNIINRTEGKCCSVVVFTQILNPYKSLVKALTGNQNIRQEFKYWREMVQIPTFHSLMKSQGIVLVVHTEGAVYPRRSVHADRCKCKLFFKTIREN